MRTGFCARTLSLVICALLLWTNLPAQEGLGPQRLRYVPAPTLRNRTRLNVGMPRVGRPRLSFVGRVGGVAFDSVARPGAGLTVSSLGLNYSPSRRDGERLALTINGRAVAAPLYDWQLVPVAKFANSDSYSCFTLFGRLNDPEEQRRVLGEGGRVLNYHEDFVNTLMGLRLFQLDNLIINDYAHELPRGRSGYIMGEGEPPPDTEANRKGLDAFRRYKAGHGDLFKQGDSYVISDRGRQVTFNVTGNSLRLQGEPSYYFWRMDEAALARLFTGEALIQVRNQLLAEVQTMAQSSAAVNPRQWLIRQLLRETLNYERQIGDYRFLTAFKRTQLVELLSTTGVTPQQTHARRVARLSNQSLESILDQLVWLRIFANVQQASPVPELSDRLSNETAMLRAINPAVWDAGVTVMQYAAFFRYCKARYPKQWRLFMQQLRRAPPLTPPVVTPTVMEAASD